MNKKGFMTELLLLVVIGIICAIFFAGWYYSSNLVNNVLTSGNLDSVINLQTSSINDRGQVVAQQNNFTVNISQASNATFTQVNNGYNLLGFVAAFIMIAFLLGTLLTCYFSPGHPILVFVYIMITIVMTIFSFYISNAYQSLLSTTGIGSVLTSWQLITFFMRRLPYIIAFTGLFGSGIAIVRYYSGGQQ